VPAGVPLGWQPYSDGEWVWTEYGWTWVSFDPWGGDPCHFGSWAWVDPWGWAWVPGTVWAPAWVTWCDSGDFIGWAPLPPTFAFAAGGYFGAPVVVSRASYVFVPSSRLAGFRVTSFRVPAVRNAALVARGRNLTSFRVSGGIVTNVALPVRRVATAMGRPVPRLGISAARTDPRPIPRGVGRRMTVAAAPAAVRAALAGRPIATRASRARAMVQRGTLQRRTTRSPSRAVARRFDARSSRPRPRNRAIPVRPWAHPAPRPSRASRRPMPPNRITRSPGSRPVRAVSYRRVPPSQPPRPSRGAPSRGSKPVTRRPPRRGA